ncbi:hypothetical protein LEP1GSC195_1457 [Leptospira wolbachii serovar Codice str. CDC]|uniref:Outer membrane protein, TIGR04327 family n=1 Tax=Leptospira wolbachii serovar Codice str. CDC TaxID=1218599 RepID=R9A747_9LEPT|nr:hypothetical protein [Leptospira wolbachii]EOQ97819.1 hypothetical protein LEP1GSC195_1457 [Leptospira wolbachii serovar Codice str. CDC]
MNTKQIIKLITLFFIINNLVEEIYSQEITNQNKERKKVHIYIMPYSLSRYDETQFRRRSEDINISILYGITNRFFLGFTYNFGENSKSYNRFVPSAYSGYMQTGEFSRSRYGEYFMIRSQYFFYENFYASLNIGVEKSFTTEQKNFIYIGRNIEVQPYSKITTYSDRYFSTLGIGYRKEFFENFLIGTEFEFGTMNSSKVRNHYTFDPGYFNGLPHKYRMELNFPQEPDRKESKFSYISIYAGIGF